MLTFVDIKSEKKTFQVLKCSLKKNSEHFETVLTTQRPKYSQKKFYFWTFFQLKHPSLIHLSNPFSHKKTGFSRFISK